MTPDPDQNLHQLLPWYVTGTLEEREQSRFEDHLADCVPCREEFELLARVRSEFERHGTTLLEPHPPSEQIVALARDELGTEEAASVRRHVALCAACATETRWVRGGAVRREQPDDRSPGVPWGWIAAVAATVSVFLILFPRGGPSDPTRVRHPAFLVPPERAAGPTPSVVTLDASADRPLLILELNLPSSAFPLDLAITDAKGKTVYTRSGITEDSILQRTYLFVDCNPRDCPPGAYTARVRGSEASSMLFRFEVR
jgi:hypothetical protein